MRVRAFRDCGTGPNSFRARAAFLGLLQTQISLLQAGTLRLLMKIHSRRLSNIRNATEEAFAALPGGDRDPLIG
jgi:hypothetical protein